MPFAAAASCCDSPAGASFVEAIFDRVPDVVFFLKDALGRYTVVNETLVRRCGVRSKAELIGRRPQELFPDPLGESYAAQDRQVLAGHALRDRLELHLRADGRPGWCLTYKLPLFEPTHGVVGLAGISRDLRLPDQGQQAYRPIAEAIEYLQDHFGEALQARDLARVAGLPPARFQRTVRRIFELSPGQLLIKTRLDAAARLLSETDMSVAEVAHECGYCDHSAFTRQFKWATALTPTRFREAVRSGPHLVPSAPSAGMSPPPPLQDRSGRPRTR